MKVDAVPSSGRRSTLWRLASLAGTFMLLQVLTCSVCAEKTSKRVIDLTIVNKVINPDGFDRPTVLAGGTFPGQLITGYKGDHFAINVSNKLTDDTMIRTTSVHWHGIYQNKTGWADGTAEVTQCPIVPGNSFLYEFSVPNQAGTFWYHSHDSIQYCDGLRGPFIVYDRDDPHRGLYDFDDASTIITLSEWYHQSALLLEQDEAEKVSNATLINGRGRYLNGPAVPLTVIEVVPFKRYRLRIISMSCEPRFTFSIDGHQLTVIEADGENTEPLLVDSLEIHAGQRYSVILHANQPVDNYWIRSEPNAMHGTVGFAGGINSAILRYKGAPIADPTTTQKPSVNPLHEWNLRALGWEPAPGHPHRGLEGADVALHFSYVFSLKTFKWRINGKSWEAPPTPVLLQVLGGSRTAQDFLPKDMVYPLPPNKVIEVSVSGRGRGQHPFHLHGHSFAVVRSAGSEVYNYESPVRRDTVDTGSGNDNVTIRFVTDNNGPWFFHCHIDWHLGSGMAVVLAENTDGIAHEPTPPDAWDQLCPAYSDFISKPAIST